jgi:hypothetical protein
MEQQNKAPQEEQKTPYQRFEEGLKQILSVPKEEAKRQPLPAKETKKRPRA